MFGNLSFLILPSWDGSPSLPLLSLFLSLYFFLSPLKDNGLLLWGLMSSASIQKLFCGIYSAFKCSFDEFVGGESGLPILFLCHLRTAPQTFNFSYSSGYTVHPIVVFICISLMTMKSKCLKLLQNNIGK